MNSKFQEAKHIPIKINMPGHIKRKQQNIKGNNMIPKTREHTHIIYRKMSE